jgi:hypothetical protein
MRSRPSLLLLLCFGLFATPLFAIERWILISGTTGNFHTDARILNPSFDKDVQLTATFYPLGTAGASGSTTLTVPKRQMRILNDVTTELFNTSNLGAILFTSSDEFEVTSRIYAITAAGTLGQFGPGVPVANAKTKGALLQLRSTASPFRTNVGLVNPNTVPANVTWTVYSKTNAVAVSKAVAYAPGEVLGPTNMAAYFASGSADISDAWISFSSDQPVFAYASVVDNGTTDQTFVPAVDDKGTAPPPPPPQQTVKKFSVELQDFDIQILPNPTGLKVGDQIELSIRNNGGLHGFQVTGAQGEDYVPNMGQVPENQTFTRTFTIRSNGSMFYFCTQTTCGVGHTSMGGSILVGNINDDPGDGKGY